MEEMFFSQLFKQKRHTQHLTQEAVAEQIGTTPVAVGHYERGQAYPSAEKLKKICEVLDLDFATVQDIIAKERANQKAKAQSPPVVESQPAFPEETPQALARRYHLLVHLMRRGAMTLSELYASCISLNVQKSVLEQDLEVIRKETEALFFNQETEEILWLPFLPRGHTRNVLSDGTLEKRALAQYAIDHYIHHGNTIWIDGGSSAYILMRELTKEGNKLEKSNSQIRVVTNNLYLFQLYCLAQNRVVETFKLLGGKYDTARSLLLHSTDESSTDYDRIDAAFVVPDYITPDKMTTLHGYAGMKKKIVFSAKKTIFLAVPPKWVHENPAGDVLITLKELEEVDYTILAPDTPEMDEKKSILPQSIRDKHLTLVPLEAGDRNP